MMIWSFCFLLLLQLGAGEEKCTKSAKLDVQIIVDSSYSVGKENFHKMMKNIASSVVGEFDIGPDKTRVALFKYSHKRVMRNEFGLNAYATKSDIQKKIENTKFEPGYTLTAMAMNLALKSFKKLQRKDKETARVCLIFTDGEANDKKKVSSATKAWADDGVKVFVIGIGKNVKHEGLKAIAGADERAFEIANFDAIADIASGLLKQVCKDVDGAFPKEYGKMILRNERYSGVDSLAALKVSSTPNVMTGPGFGNLIATHKAAWVDRQFINSWNTQFSSGKFTKVRFTFWRKEANTIKPVVDIIFNGRNTNIDQWFQKDKVLQIVHGPNVKAKLSYNYWSSKGHERRSDVYRHFFVNKNYGGCDKDFGMLCVADGVDVCQRTWMQGIGWQSFPRFLYSSKTNGCLFKDSNCMKEADVFTISALQPADSDADAEADAFPKEYGKMILRNERYSGVNSLAALKVSGTPNVKTGPGFGNLMATHKAAWVDREFINSWNTQFSSGKFTKVRFTFWRKEAKAVKPVVDIIFNGQNSNIDQWFQKDKVFQIVHGPNVKAKLSYNYWSSKGHERHSDVYRHFFVNKNYGGCDKDFGMLCVADGIDVCQRTWMQGIGWQSFPRFLYSSKTNGCLFKDSNCMKEADILTISAL